MLLYLYYSLCIRVISVLFSVYIYVIHVLCSVHIYFYICTKLGVYNRKFMTKIHSKKSP